MDSPISYRGVMMGNVFLTGAFGGVLLLAPELFIGVLGVEEAGGTVLFC